MRSIQKRLDALEKRLDSPEITLRMADGTIRLLRAKRLVDILHETGHGIWRSDAIAIGESVSDDAYSKGNGQLPQLLRLSWRHQQRISAERRTYDSEQTTKNT